MVVDFFGKELAMNNEFKRHFNTTITACIIQAVFLVTPSWKLLAEDNTQVSEQENSITNNTLTKKLGLISDISFSTNGYKKGTTSNEMSTGASLTTNYTTDYKFDIGMINEFSKDLTDAKESSISDIIIYANKSFKQPNDYTLLSGTAYTVLPASETSRKDTSLRAGFILAPSVTFDLKPIGLKYVSYGLTLTHARYFHEYYVSATGSSNTKYYYRLTHSLTYSPLETLAINFTLKTTRPTTYHGNTKHITYSESFDVTKKISERLGIYIGLTNAGDFFKPNGVDSNVKFVDNETTNYSVGFTYKF